MSYKHKHRVIPTRLQVSGDSILEIMNLQVQSGLKVLLCTQWHIHNTTSDQEMDLAGVIQNERKGQARIEFIVNYKRCFFFDTSLVRQILDSPLLLHTIGFIIYGSCTDQGYISKEGLFCLCNLQLDSIEDNKG